MSTIRVTTTVEITDERGQHIGTVTNTATAKPGDNPRYYATYTRGAIQSTEHQINAALVAQYGDKPAAPAFIPRSVTLCDGTCSGDDDPRCVCAEGHRE